MSEEQTAQNQEQEATKTTDQTAEKAESKKDAAQEPNKETAKAGTSTPPTTKEDDGAAQAAVTAQLEQVNQRLIYAEALITAGRLGFNPDRVEHAVRIADLSGVKVDDKGKVDTETVKAALSKVLEEIPEFKAAANTASGFKVGSDGEGKKSDKITSLADAVRDYYKK